MAKIKFDLTSDLVTSNKELNQDTSLSEKTVTITFRVNETFRSEYKTWCAQHKVTAVSAFKQGFDLLKSNL